MVGAVGTAARGAYGYARSIATSPTVHRAAGRVYGAAQGYAGTAFHARGVGSLKAGMGLGKGMGIFGRALGLGFLGYETYSGYQREGMWGAAKGAAGYAAIQYAFGAVLGSSVLPLMAGAAAVGGAVVGRKMAAEKGESVYKRHRALEFGAGVSDQFGTISTMRRRSIQALQSSRIGGGMGMGNEAMRSYVPYFR